MTRRSAMSQMHDATIFVSAAVTAGGDGSHRQPVATLAEAVQLARASKARRIRLGAGEYFDSSITLDGRDSGLTIEGEGATLYGGRAVHVARREGDRVYCPIAGDVPVRLLLVDGVAAKRARFPHSGQLLHTTDFPVPWLSTSEGGWQRPPTDAELLTLHFKTGDLPRSLSVRNAEVAVYHMWDESCVPLLSIDFEAGVMRFASPAGYPPGAFGVKKYVIWNTLEGLCEPGTFYHDRELGQIVYRLRPGEEPRRLIAATQSSIIQLRRGDQTPSDITLCDLRLEATTAALIPGDFGALAYRGAVDLFSGHGHTHGDGSEKRAQARGITLRNLVIRHCAGYGVSCGQGALSDSAIEDCAVANCGAGGICFRGERLSVRRNAVSHTGLYFPAGVAIYSGSGDDCLIEGNRVDDCSYSGIISTGNRNKIRHNSITGAMRELFDGAAIYVTSARSNVIEENDCRDISGPGAYHRAGYYLDERTEDTVVRGNRALDVDVPLQNHMTRACLMEGNDMRNRGDLRIHAARCEALVMRGNTATSGGVIRVSGINHYSELAGNTFFSRAGRYEFIELDKYRPAATTSVPPRGIEAKQSGEAGTATGVAAAARPHVR